jgi:hypothetical protein
MAKGLGALFKARGFDATQYYLAVERFLCAASECIIVDLA